MKDTVKTILTWTGIAVVAAGYVAYHYYSIEKDTQTLASQMVKSIVTDWNISELDEHKHVTLKAALRENNETLEDSFSIYEKLGKANRLSRCELKPNTASLIGNMGGYKLADYTCDAEFKNGDATILISLRKDDPEKKGDPENDWEITTFRIRSPFFARMDK